MPESNITPPNALHIFASDVAADLHASDAAGETDGVMKIIDVTIIISIVQAIIQFIRSCKPTPTPTPVSDGEVLVQAANDAYNEKRHEFRGLEYNVTVREAMKQSALKGRKNKRAEAVSVAKAILTKARETDSNKADAIAACVR